MITRFLSAVTMYRLTVYGLIGLLGIGLVVSLTGRLSFAPHELLLSAALVLAAGFGVNALFARLWRVPTNRESWLITSLILVLVLPPAHSLLGCIALALAGGVASASKFVLAPLGKHLFNPAAFAAAFVSLGGLYPATWWVGTSALWPFTLLLGLVIVLKIKRYALLGAFVVAVVALQAIVFAIAKQPVSGLVGAVTASPLLFLGGVMLTEPSTMPPRRSQQIIFGLIIAVLYVLAPRIGLLIVYPEVALLAGNIYAFAVSPKRRYRLTLARIEPVSARVYNYVFESDYPIRYRAGQYMEFTLAGVPEDGRGNRRTFTIASSPSEDMVQVGLKYYDPSSEFKDVFSRLALGDSVWAGQVSGSFTLGGHTNTKRAFIAGGIGITPFRSMVKQIIDENTQADCVVLYAVTYARELAYRDVFAAGRTHGVRFVPLAANSVSNDGVPGGRITEDVIRQYLPDYHDRHFYISGPNTMVTTTKTILRRLGVRRSRIRTDYFSGY